MMRLLRWAALEQVAQQAAQIGVLIKADYAAAKAAYQADKDDLSIHADLELAKQALSARNAQVSANMIQMGAMRQQQGLLIPAGMRVGYEAFANEDNRLFPSAFGSR